MSKKLDWNKSRCHLTYADPRIQFTWTVEDKHKKEKKIHHVYQRLIATCARWDRCNFCKEWSHCYTSGDSYFDKPIHQEWICCCRKCIDKIAVKRQNCVICNRNKDIPITYHIVNLCNKCINTMMDNDDILFKTCNS